MVSAGGIDEKTKRPAAPRIMPPVIAKAIVAIQKELKPLTKTSTNLEYGNKFVPLPEVMTKAIELLSQHGIAVMQPPVTDEHEHIALETTLIHKSGVGYSKTTRLALGKADPQGHASAITYTRRYALMGMLGLTSEDDDDDGNKAAGVMLKVTDEQLDRIRSLLTALRYPREQIASEVFNIKTADHADLAILNYEKLVSVRVRDEESKQRATKIEVGDGEAADPEDERTVGKRIQALGLKDAKTVNKLVNHMTGKPSLKFCRAKEIELLSKVLDGLEAGRTELPAEWYEAGHAPIKGAAAPDNKEGDQEHDQS